MGLRAVVLALGAVAAATAATAAAHRVASPTYTVEFQGKGTYSRDAKAPSGCGSTSSSDRSKFGWDVIWKNVAITAASSAGKPYVGILRGEASQTYHGYDLNTPGCTAASKSCAGVFAANQDGQAGYPATLEIARKGSGFQLVSSLKNSPSHDGSWEECASAALNESSEKYMIFGLPYSATDTYLAPVAAVGSVSAAALAQGAKITIHVIDRVSPKAGVKANYPGLDASCNVVQTAGFECTHHQSWAGTITITRSK